MNRRASVVVCVFVLAALRQPDRRRRRARSAPSGCAYTDLQAAIDAAAFGDTILLRAGETFVGHYTLRAKPGSGVIVIRSDAADSGLPAAGARLVPSTRRAATRRCHSWPRIIGRGGAYKSAPLLRTEPGAHGYVVRFIDFDGVCAPRLRDADPARRGHDRRAAVRHHPRPRLHPRRSLQGAEARRHAERHTA